MNLISIDHLPHLNYLNGVSSIFHAPPFIFYEYFQCLTVCVSPILTLFIDHATVLTHTDDTNKNPNRDQTTVTIPSGKPSLPPTIPTLPSTIPTISAVPSVQEANGQDPSCDSYGLCYDVKIKCTDTKIVVNVQTSRPFHGRIYALGRSETCNLNVRNNQQFTLDISLGGQDCNTQSVVSNIYCCNP